MWAFAVAGWVAVVIAGSGLTWIAIERAGDQVTVAPESADATRPAVLGTLGPAPTAPGMPSESGATPSGTTPSGTPGRPSSPTTSSPSAPLTRAGTATPRPPGPTVQSVPQTAVRTEMRTWSGTPGSLTVSCTGGQVSFRSASPSNGWSFERDGSSGEEIEVTFKSGESEVQVRATCAGGVPQFSVESGSDHE
jgi:hypothetical protein